jgi:vacuolar-type H+-ATPase subunit I/STV1
MVFYKNLNDYQEKIFDMVLIITYILIFSSFLGLSSNAFTYLNDVDYYFKVYICLFLVWRFNPFRKFVTFTNLDRKIAFHSGVFILTATLLQQYINDIKLKVQENDYINNIKNITDQSISKISY